MPAQIAPADGSSFEKANNAAFPALATSLQATSTGLSAPGSNQSATVTVTSTGTATYYDPCQGYTATGLGAKIQLSIPSVNVNVSLSEPDIRNVDVSYTTGLNYVLLGNWYVPPASAPPALQNVTWFVFGYETPAASMPVSGQATFAGAVEGNVFTANGGNISTSNLFGLASFSADFSSGKITGAFTNIRALGATTNSWTPWNDVSVSASVGGGTNKFSGVTAVTSSPPGPATLAPSAAGTINGAFYGPSAQNLGAIWTLSDGKASAIGGVAAAR